MGNPVPPWSHSRLSSFENCPRAFEATHVSKTVQDVKGEAVIWGQEVHTHFENRLKDGVALPHDLEKHEKFMAWLDAMPGKSLVEAKIALDRQLRPCGFFDDGVWYRGVIDYGKVYGEHARLIDHKGLPLDTLISTPEGFTTMGEVQVGDLVHASDGKAYPVTIKSKPTKRRCYKITFDDKTSVVCDNVHLWSLVDGSVVPVTELIPGRSKIPIAAPVEMPAQNLPIDPYVVGLWLADGKHTSSEICKPDAAIWAEVERRGYQLGKQGGHGNNGVRTHTVLGIRGYLNALGLLGNKHIPSIYLHGSVQQRLDLLRGLMDGDGNPNPVRKQVIFQNTNKNLSNAVKQLVESLGYRVSQAAHKYYGFGVTGIAYPLAWRPWRHNPFLLPRKADRVGAWGSGRSAYRIVKSVELVSPQVTQCIGVASPDNTYLCGRERVVTHNTGKFHAKFGQLKLFAIHTFAAYPEVQQVRAEYYWTQTLTTNGETYTRDQIPQLWQEFLPGLRQYAQAFHENIWQPRQSGLCNGWCGVTSCEFWRPKRKRT